MKIKYLGHSCFMITASNGTKVIADPYKTGTPWPPLKYGEIKESADIVTVSHEHGDHNDTTVVQGDPVILKGKTDIEIKGIVFKGISTYHDNVGGKERGSNTVFRYRIDNMAVCHLGDLGHLLSTEQMIELGTIDILLVPVGGAYTFDWKLATETCINLKPKIIIPMHYKTDKLGDPKLGTEENFLKGRKDVSRLDSSEIEFTVNSLPKKTRVILLKCAL